MRLSYLKSSERPAQSLLSASLFFRPDEMQAFLKRQTKAKLEGGKKFIMVLDKSGSMGDTWKVL
jgi:hypothetical protein